MARGINKVIIIGNLGADPDVRYMPNGSPVASVSLATSDVWRDKESGEQREKTEWHRVVFFSRLAEIVGEYLKKGSKIYIEGSLRTRKWQDKAGVDRYTTEIVANEMQMLDAKGASPSGPSASMTQASAAESSHPSQGAPASTSAPSHTADPASGGFADDDIPF